MLMEMLIMMSLTLGWVMALWMGQRWLMQREMEIKTWLEYFETRAWLKQLMNDEIHRAGYTPCLSIRHIWMNEWMAAYDIYPHALVIRRMDEPLIRVRVLNERTLEILDAHRLREGQKYLLSDCFGGVQIEIMQVMYQGTAQQVILSEPLPSLDWSEETVMGTWIQETFKVKAGQGLMLKVEGKPTLCLSRLVKQWEVREIKPGLIELKLDYGPKPSQIIRGRVRA